jgi:hypothetical protein
VVAHELPQDGQQQLVLPVHDIDAPDVHQRQAQHAPRDAHHLRTQSSAYLGKPSLHMLHSHPALDGGAPCALGTKIGKPSSSCCQHPQPFYESKQLH